MRLTIANVCLGRWTFSATLLVSATAAATALLLPGVTSVDHRSTACSVRHSCGADQPANEWLLNRPELLDQHMIRCNFTGPLASYRI